MTELRRTADLCLEQNPDALVTNLVNYVVGPMTGAILATLLFRATNGGEYGARGYLEMS